MKTIQNSSVVFFCLCIICCPISRANDETTSMSLHDADENQIGIIDSSGQLISQTVDASDQPLTKSGHEIPSPAAEEQRTAVAARSAQASTNTIDKINLDSYVYESYSPSSGMVIGGRVTAYNLSDGSSWSSGAGSASYGRMQFERMETDGSTAHFYFTHNNLLLRRTDYNSGSHSANFELHVDGPLVIVAQAGSQQGVLEGQALVVSDQPANYNDSRFNYLSALPGSVVRFGISYALRGSDTFSSGLFDNSFTYTYSGAIDLTDVVSSPALTDISLVGPPIAPEDAVVSYSSLATFEYDSQRVVTADSQWSCSRPEIASFISPGKLQISPVEQNTELTLHVAYTDQGIQRTDQKTITVVDIDIPTTDIGWPMFQANERHDGYVPVTLDKDQFNQLWQTTIGTGSGLNRVTAAAGKVFTSGRGSRIDVVDSQTGVVLWTELLASYRHGSFPSYANGVVYFQTGNHGNDTWLRAYDAESGQQIFKAPHSAQWEDYYAPTLYNNKVYINGGYYGGAYCFDAYSGHQDWFIGLPQYDDWTPAVDEEYVYAYVGAYSPGLYVMNRLTGNLAFKILDPSFDWNGWSMNLAPVIGGQGNVLAIHDGRLINFDIESRQIAYEIQERFTGQVSVAKGRVYAINDGNIDIRDESTGDLLSTVDISDGFYDAMIITDSHIFARSTSTTYAISLETKHVEWQYPLSGYMALSDDRLYIADSSGRLTAILAPMAESTTPPVADAGEDQEVDAGLGCTATVTLDGSGSSDADGDMLSFQWSAPGITFDDPTSMTPTAAFPIGATNVTLLVSDGAFESEDMITVTIVDTTPPSIETKASDMTVECDGAGNMAELQAWLDAQGGAIATDTCGSVTWSNGFSGLSDDCGATGSATVTFTATDGAGLTATTSATFSIVDTTEPNVTCPENVTVTWGDPTDPSATGMAMGLDVCDPTPVIGSNDNMVPTTCPADPVQEVIERTWTATDACENDSSCLQTITVLKKVLPLDIKPGSCPNSYNRGSHGILPVGLLGTADFDVSTVDLSSVVISRADCIGGAAAPHEGPPGPHSVFSDVGTPFPGALCNCHELTGDGRVDLSIKFKTDNVVSALQMNDLPAGALVELVVSGTLTDGCRFIASDCVRLVPPGTPPGLVTVNSNLEGAWISITPLDTQLEGGGFGRFERTWPQRTVATFATEEFYLGQRFVGWKFDGQFFSREMTADVTVIDETQTVDAVFRREGDITGDQAIDLYDFAMFAACFGQRWGNNLSGNCSNEALASSDLDRNGVIDLYDFAIFAIHFGT